MATKRTLALSSLMTICALLSACSVFQGPAFDPGLQGQERYLCCTTRFSTGFAASDANYGRYYAQKGVYSEGPLLPAGTKVVVTEVRGSGVTFHTQESAMSFEMNFGYGKRTLSASDYFGRILLPADPTAALASTSPTMLADIRAGRLVEGMTKDQALMARGYPPAHRTPDINADAWLYYESPGFVDRVTFTGGKISAITHEPAPQ